MTSESASPGPPRLRFKPALLEPYPYDAAPPAPATAQQQQQASLPIFTSRLHEIIQRVGEICLSPELAHVMLFPAHALAHQACLTTPLDYPQEYHDLCHDHTAILFAMQDMDNGEPHTAQLAADAGKFLARFQADCLPPPSLVKFRQPLHVCAWRIESPTRTLLLVHHSGQPDQNPAETIQADPLAFKPHQLPKHLLDERSKRPQPSAIHLLPNDADLTSQAVRDSLLHHVKTSPASFTPPSNGNAQDTTLEEAACVFTAGPAANHSEIELNQSPPWEKDHIDSRSASYLHALTHAHAHIHEGF
jgi:hypothetical protein